MIYYHRSNQEPVTDWVRDESKDSTFASGELAYKDVMYSPFWTNFDLYCTDNYPFPELAGTVAIAASEPIPVYE